jgi:hypothetical protein
VNKTASFTWSQTISDLTINIPVPEGTTGKQIEWIIKTNYIKLAIRGQTPSLLEGELSGLVKPSDCTWTLGS